MKWDEDRRRRWGSLRWKGEDTEVFYWADFCMNTPQRPHEW